MASRMDKYKSEDNNTEQLSRLSKHESLYKEISNNKTYTEFTDLAKDNVFEINNSVSYKTRRSEKDNVRTLFGDNNIENVQLSRTNKPSRFLEPVEKNYDVNDVLEEARRNRSELDEEEKKRKLKNVEYSILNDLSQEKIKDYHEKKERGITEEERENLAELINTITSKSLRKNIDDELLNDLMPDDDDTKDIDKELVDEIEKNSNDDIDDNEEKEDKEDDTYTGELTGDIDKSFYTRSMDLKKEDLFGKEEVEEIEEEIDESFTEKSNDTLKNIALFLLVVLVLGIIGYIVFNFI